MELESIFPQTVGARPYVFEFGIRHQWAMREVLDRYAYLCLQDHIAQGTQPENIFQYIIDSNL